MGDIINKQIGLFLLEKVGLLALDKCHIGTMHLLNKYK